MKPGSWSFTGGALAVSGALVVALLVLILFLNARVRDHESRYELARQDYARLTKMRIQYRELEARMLKVVVESGPPVSWPEFLDQKAKEAGLSTPNITPELSSRGPLKETAYTVTLDAGSNATVSRRQFVRFMDLVESQRPGFKSKALAFKFSSAAPDDFQRASATFSHFER